jgi:hypothetical protein
MPLPPSQNPNIASDQRATCDSTVTRLRRPRAASRSVVERAIMTGEWSGQCGVEGCGGQTTRDRNVDGGEGREAGARRKRKESTVWPVKEVDGRKGEQSGRGGRGGAGLPHLSTFEERRRASPSLSIESFSERPDGEVSGLSSLSGSCCVGPSCWRRRRRQRGAVESRAGCGRGSELDSLRRL